MSDPSVFSVAQLKGFLRDRALSTTGAKAELIARLAEADPSGEWMEVRVSNDIPNSGLGGDDQHEDSMHRRELEVCRREKEIAERELQLARLEIALLRERQHMDTMSLERRQETPASGGSGVAVRSYPRQSLTVISDLLADFDGISGDFDAWEKQVRLLRTTYQLEDDDARLLIGMKLKRRALEWFRSKPEFISMSFDGLINELRGMFWHRPNRIAMRKKFETRVWTRDETFHEYVHEKIIMGNRVPIEADEMIDYIIDGITDYVLRDQARMHRFTSIESLLHAFETITLRDRGTTNSNRPDKRNNRQAITEGDGRTGANVRRNDNTSGDDKKSILSNNTRCFNCGARDHISASCPSKTLGTKCFECGNFGHIAAKCSKRVAIAPRSSCAVTSSSRRKYTKRVLIDGVEFEALIDTGSDISLMRADEYVKMGSPRFRTTTIRFSGVGSDEMTALGEFCAELAVDGHSYPILIRVVSGAMSQQKLLVGTDFLDTVEVNVQQGSITISPVDEKISNADSPVADVFRIDVEGLCDVTKVDAVHVPDTEYKNAVTTLIENYQPNQTYETGVKMKIILTDDEPVRRLFQFERDNVNNQIDSWERQGIVRPSFSDYASPIVLVEKKDDSYRLCVDYRMLNRKMVKDRYPLPLIEDQLDMLQNVKIFSIIDLKNSFFHVPMDEPSIKYTAFAVPDGHYEFLRVPFGLCNSPSVFQRYVNTILLQRNSEDQLLHPIYYASGRTTRAKKKYTSCELEVLAIVKALKPFRVYFLGISFKIVTDCRAFTLAMGKRDNIVKIQCENKRHYDRSRREARRYREGDLVAIRRTQQKPGLKLEHKYLGPYEITKVLRNDRYLIQKIGEHEGPTQTSSAADCIKPWVTGSDDGLSEDDAEAECEYLY